MGFGVGGKYSVPGVRSFGEDLVECPAGVLGRAGAEVGVGKAGAEEGGEVKTMEEDPSVELPEEAERVEEGEQGIQMFGSRGGDGGNGGGILTHQEPPSVFFACSLLGWNLGLRT